MKSLLPILLATVLGSPVASAQTLRQLGPHVHGVTTVDIGVDGGTLQVSVSAPATNMLGFEHPPHDAGEQARLDQVLAALRSPGAWLLPADAAQCRVDSADVQPHGLDAAKTATDGHADFDARYVFHCEQPQRLDHLDVHLADRYPGTHRVVINLVLPDRQDRQVLETGQYRVSLAP